MTLTHQPTIEIFGQIHVDVPMSFGDFATSLYSEGFYVSFCDIDFLKE